MTPVCNWTEDDDGGPWSTDCGHLFEFIDGGPSDNRFAWCCYCGKEIVEAPLEPDDVHVMEEDEP